MIQKLAAQEAGGATPAQLLQTVQELHAALGAQQQQAALPAGGRVAVLMPALPVAAAVAAVPAPQQEPAPVNPAPVFVETPAAAEPDAPAPIVPVAAPPAEVPAAPVEAPPVPEPPAPEPAAPAPSAPEPYVLQKPEVIAPAPPAQPAYVPPAYEPPPPAYTPPPTPPPSAYTTPAFNPLEEVPTLAQQAPSPEVHRALGEGGASLNDRLKQEHVELGKKLTGGPIKDLRKGISLNDRYLFISELFRGDEAMYERSIKTINGFHILPEAEYWINRELKLKLGWPDGSETVQQFDQLVRRRFS
ncbi:hypothetical protein [Flaviaesturariibacter amylovorans]|uniref:hypothetical protein n=1 Tax=Flaviaesturariibacter amylovorans TaxID=1084520 RepID=UPI0031EB46C4